MGEEAYQRMVTKLTAITLVREQDVFRYRGDLSYAPASAGGSTSSTASQWKARTKSRSPTTETGQEAYSTAEADHE
jgi:hypothetical protein